mgnify:CR=1 FL=1
MNTPTQAALDKLRTAIEEYVVLTQGADISGILGDFVVLSTWSAYENGAVETSYSAATPPEQPIYRSVGLVSVAGNLLDLDFEVD